MATQSEFQLQTTNTPQDFQQFQSYYCAKHLRVGRRMISAVAYQLLLSIVFVPASLVAFKVLGYMLGVVSVDFGLIGIVLGGALALFVYFKTANRILARFWKVDLGNFTTPTDFVISAEGIRSTSENGESLLRWRAVRDVVGSPVAIYLGLGGATAMVLPRRAFRSEEEASNFLTFAQEQIAANSGPAGAFA